MRKPMLALCALLLAAPAVGQTLFSTTVGSDAPVRIYPVNREDSFLDKRVTQEPLPLTLTFWLENTTGQFVEDVSITAFAFSDDGLPRGFHSYVIRDSIPPFSSVYFHYVTSDLKVKAGDRVIPLVDAARSGGELWQIGESLTGEAVLANTYMPDPISHPFQKGVGADGTCEGKCAARQALCDLSCSRCTEQSFGCTCGTDGTVTHTCTCSGCKPVV